MLPTQAVFLAGLLLASVAAQLPAQEEWRRAEYGRAVHEYNAGKYRAAASRLERLVLSGEASDHPIDDPRVFYFQGLAAQKRRLDPKPYFEEGAKLEAKSLTRYNIGKALSRVQGPVRKELDHMRTLARLVPRRGAGAEGGRQERDDLDDALSKQLQQLQRNAFKKVVLNFNEVEVSTEHAADLGEVKSNEEVSSRRREVIVTRLKQLGIAPHEFPFEYDKIRHAGLLKGTNVMVALPGKGPRTLWIGAHYDRVATGRGVVDNACSCAVLLHLLERFQEVPLQNRVQFWFFDLEEVGLVGSKLAVEERKDQLPDVYLNFDVFGFGDSLWVMSPEAASLTKQSQPGQAALKNAASSASFPVTLASNYPLSDHLSFINAGVPALSFALIDRTDIPLMGPYCQEWKTHIETFKQLEQLDKATYDALKSGAGTPAKDSTRLMKIMHTEEDTVFKLNEEQVFKALSTIEKLVRSIDKDLG